MKQVICDRCGKVIENTHTIGNPQLRKRVDKDGIEIFCDFTHFTKGETTFRENITITTSEDICIDCLVELLQELKK